MAYMDFKDLQDNVLTRDYGATATRTNIKVWINDAYRDVVRERRWTWTQETATVVTVANTATVAMPTDWLYTGWFQPANSTTPKIQWLDDQHPELRPEFTTRTGAPTTVRPWEGLWIFQPTPDAVYTWTLYYYKRSSQMTQDADLPLIPQDERDVLIYGALIRAAEMDRSFEGAQYYQAQYERALSKMRQRDGIRHQQQVAKAPMPGAWGGRYDR